MNTNEEEPKDGIFAIPQPNEIPNYNMAELFYYCKQHNIKPLQLSDVERKMFIIRDKKD
ncbi:hypothetical protein [Bacillus toyonensis]|uniref:hypothetical protein n=1 Tax=Bacillus toyonensis TaxID=155322 RepID=UPI002E20AA3D|nr:hypothetical protein [Bacillus toyonensis]